MKHLKTITALALGMAATTASADLVAHFPMDVRSGQIQDVVSGSRFGVEGHFAPENVDGAVAGKALRFDGYTSWVDATVGDIVPEGSRQMSVSLWVAVPCYPIIKIDQNTPEMTPIVTCLNETDKTGFGFYIGFDGRYSFRTYVGGWPVNIDITTPLPVYAWNHLVAVVDADARRVTLYNNGTEVGSSRCNGTVAVKAGAFTMGRGSLLNYSGPFLLSSFNGLIDEVKVWNEAVSADEINAKAENEADLKIPASRYAESLLRPRFHGMPATAWTNECHGMTYSDGRYHVFFQKNANGPYMARLHWGHISSENLYDWREEKIAIAPGAAYDIKGCWSGCVFTDPEITGNLPAIIYTGVDYARATIDGASPTDATLLNWNKWTGNPVINGRPGTLTDDFRDPYFFRVPGGDAYIIVGSSKDGVGTTSLHRYDPASKTWSNDGKLFFTGSSANVDGTFWEMPNITRMPDGRWLFTATPLGTSTGVRTIYWTGSINTDGTFAPATTASKNVELNSRDGFGLLSPTIYPQDGRVIAMGIVPDKLPSDDNWNLGWAHCYSLPREWSLADDGSLVQKPWHTLTGLRTATTFSRTDFEMNGTVSLSPVSGRAVELLAVFTKNANPVGFRIFKNGTAAGTITYNPSANSVKVDFSRLERLVNDGGVYDGIYTLPLPEFIKRGTEVKINVFIDHSILDIFINDKWASSIRVFPTAADADGVEAFSDGAVSVKQLSAWTLDAKAGAGVTDIVADPKPAASAPVYNLMGQKVADALDPATLSDVLPAGVYIHSGKKYIVR